jgi:hypothetical protein
LLIFLFGERGAVEDTDDCKEKPNLSEHEQTIARDWVSMLVTPQVYPPP